VLVATTLVAVSVGLFEQRQLCAGVGPFPTDDQAHPSQPTAQVQQGGELGDVTALANVSVGVGGERPHSFGSFAMASRTLALVAYPTEYSTVRPRFGALRGEPVQQPMGGTSAVGADQHEPAVAGGDLGDGLGQDRDVVRDGIRAGVTGTHDHREHLLAVVAPEGMT